MSSRQQGKDFDVETPHRQPFAHLSAPNAPLYRDVLMAFARAKDRFIVHMRPEDVIADLGRPGETEDVVAALDKLVEWGNLRADPDTSRVTTVEDFHRARYLYQLTAAGQAAEQAIAVYEEAIGRRGSLQSVALADIAAQLRSLADMADQEAGLDPAKVHLLLLGLAERFAGLADNAQAFMASLRRVIDFADGDVDAFIAYKQRLIDYINRFIADLANQAGQRQLLAAQAAREAAETGAARERLSTDRPVLLSELGTLDNRAFRLFLGLLGDALSARLPGDTEVRTTTSDGTMEIRLSLVRGGEETVVIPTEDGELRGPQHLVEIVDLTTASRHTGAVA